jgi:hypothetical protein
MNLRVPAAISGDHEAVVGVGRMPDGRKDDAAGGDPGEDEARSRSPYRFLVQSEGLYGR